MSEIKHYSNRATLLADVAEMYYIGGKDQSEISKQVGVTRSMISRMLTEARQRGIVEIRIHRSLESNSLLEAMLVKQFGIEHAFVVSVHNLDDERLLADLGRAGAEMMSRFLTPGMTIGLSWGTSVSAVIDAMDYQSDVKAKVVQLVGAMNARNTEYDGHTLVQRLTEKLDGEGYFLNAPYFCQNAEIAKTLMEMDGIRESIELGRKAQIGLLGIGSSEIQYSSFYLAGYVPADEIDRINKAGVVGDIAGVYFDLQGRIKFDEFSKNLITIRKEDLATIPLKIGVSGGPGKVKPILGALRSGLINVLVTDSITAQMVLELDRSV